MEHEGRDYWEALLSEYWVSGLTIQEYSELKELPYESTRRWIRVLEKARQDAVSNTEPLELVEVKPLPAVKVTTSSDDPSYFLLVWNVVAILQFSLLQVTGSPGMSASALFHSNISHCADVIHCIPAAIHPDRSAASQ